VVDGLTVIVRPSRTSCNDVGLQQWQHVALEVLCKFRWTSGELLVSEAVNGGVEADDVSACLMTSAHADRPLSPNNAS